MKKRSLLFLLALVFVLSSMAMIACGKKETLPTDIVNGSFEDAVGSLNGWTKSGTAFSASGITDKDNEYKVGKNYFDGFEAGNQQFKGTLTSDKFIFDGEAIAFKIGCGKDTEKIFVEIFEDGKSDPIAKTGNTAYEEPFIVTEMVRTVVEIPAEYKGKTLYIKVTDNDAGDDMAYVCLDDFKVLKNTEEVTAAVAERTALIEALNPPFAEDKTLDVIQNGGFEEGWKGWKLLTGTAFNRDCIMPSTEKFWTTRDFLAVGDKFFNGYNNPESAIGSMRSSMFTLGGDGFISFMIGGAGSSSLYVELCGEDGEVLTYPLANDVEEGVLPIPIRVTNDAFNDPNLALNMHRVYIDASSHKGEVMYIRVVDEAATGPFGSITLDDFRVSMTEEEVKELMKSTYEAAIALESNTINDYIKKHYKEYDYPFELEVLMFTKNVSGKVRKTTEDLNAVDLTAYLSEAEAKYGSINIENTDISITKVTKGASESTSGFDSFDISATGQYKVDYQVIYNNMTETASFIIDVTDANSVANGGFETGDLAGWEILTPDKVKAGSAVSSDSKWWGEDVPFNQAGNYHFDGWGAHHDEADAYSLKSGKFTLGGSGFISFRMGGANAMVKVFKEGGSQVAEYKNTAFANKVFPYVELGCRLATMTTFLADLSMYKGQELYLELHDIGAGLWGVAFFDEIVTYYEDAPNLADCKDTVQIRARIENPNYDESVADSAQYIQATEFSDYDIAWVEAANDYAKISVYAQGRAFKADTAGIDAFDLTTLIQDVDAVYPEGIGTGITKAIVKVVKPDEKEATDGFNAFDLSAVGTYKVFYEVTITGMNKTMGAWFNVVVSDSNQLLNGSFETGTLEGWTASAVTAGKDKTPVVDADISKAVTDASSFWGEKIPFNKSGDYLFCGGLDYISEGYQYTLTSETFTLGGSGFISFKMGAKGGVVKVFKEGGEQIAAYRNTKFADVTFPNVATGSRLGTMTTFVADLQEYIGQKLYIVIEDDQYEGWGNAIVDDIVVYYENAPVLEGEDARKDTIDNTPGREPEQAVIPWVAAVNIYEAE